MLGYIPTVIIQTIGVLIPIIGIIVLMRKGQGKENVFLVMANFGALMMNWGYFQLLRATDYQEAVSVYKFEYLGSALFYIFFVIFLKSFFLKGRKIKGIFIALLLFLCVEFGSMGAVLLDDTNAYQAISVQYRKDDGQLFTNFKDNNNQEDSTEDVQYIQDISSDLEVNLSDVKGYAFVSVTHGPILMIRFGLLAVVLLLSLIESIVLAVKRKVKEERKRMLYLIVAESVVLASLIISFYGYGTFNSTPILVSASVMVVICGTANGNFFTVADRGRGWVLDHSDNIFIIVDKEYRFLDANDYAKKIFTDLENLTFFAKLPDELRNSLMSGDSDFEYDGCCYAKKVAPIEDKGKILGYSILLVDMTAHYNLLEQVEVERQKAIDANEAKSLFMSNMSHEIRTPMNAIVGMTEIMLRHNQDSFNTEYLTNIKNSGNALLAVINDILDFSKIESGKLEIIPDDYEIMSVLNDLSMIFLNRIGEKPIELLYDVDPNMPIRMRGDANRIRQVLLNIVNNGIKYTDSGYVKLSIHMEPYSESKVKLCCAVKDTGMGIKEEDLPKLFSTFSQVDTKKNRGKEGTGLGLSISKQLVEAMGGTFTVESEYGVGSTFSFTMIQDLVDATPAARIKSDKDIYVTGAMASQEGLELLKKLCESYERVHFVNPEEVLSQKAETVHFIFADHENACKCDESEEVKDALQKYNAELITIHNPMVEHGDHSRSTVMNKPLYSLNFCLAINHEVMNFQQSQEKIMSFKAPEARILIVDDNEMNRKVAAGLLEPIEMQIDMAVDGKQAVEKITSEHYDIVFMDHMMPIMDGVEATCAIRALPDEYYQTLPIIALSANALAEAKEEFKAVGMNDFLAKPIKTKELFKMVKRYLPEDKLVELEETTGEESDGFGAGGRDSNGRKADGRELDGQMGVGWDSNGKKTDGKGLDGQAADGQRAGGWNSNGQKADGRGLDGYAFSTDNGQEELPEIEGLDVPSGIENCGNLKLYTSLLGDFYKLIDRKTSKINQCLADGLIRDFTIEVHALKNTARMIGGLELSEQFYKLEQAGNANDEEYIEAHISATLELYQSYKPILKSYADSDNAQKEQVSVDEIKETIDLLKEAMDNFDLDGADQAMKRLEQCQMPDEIRDMVTDLGALVADVAMEEVMALCDKIMEAL